ncbi:uncharacterized protein LOC117782555 [Drosophila innubila]|uniref:uncharacterized protein LOC117782555 n=1 Tax=Drosophila innubila TaxID=198719 RepID=UPI00148D8BEB|nr:uncharacterized protein LOC117782555 [Drosophila innubila]
MSISNLLSDLVLNDLKEMGIKHKDKKPKVIKISVGQPLFRQALQYLKLADAFLENGTVVQVPQFIVEACSYILEHCETEGIFRKAGSAAKQREIRKCLEAGQPLGKSHRVIDIANIVSYFFRELPEPLIPSYLHDTLVRCLHTTESNRNRSIQLTCLLIPSLTAQTLAYFMQFLHTVTRHVSSNKMSAENLAIVIAPSVMPYRDINSVRFKNHIKIVELLIENASMIGTIPACIREKLGNVTTDSLAGTVHTRKVRSECSSIAKNKNRRSHLFSALKTKVGLTMSSSENLDCPAKLFDNSNHLCNPELQKKTCKETNTRSGIIVKTQKFTEPFNAFRARKNEKKHSHANLAGNQGTSNVTSVTKSNMEHRRWSLVTAGWSKNNKKENISNNLNISVSDIGIKDQTDFFTLKVSNSDDLKPISFTNTCKNEYDAIMERVASIETQNPSPKVKTHVHQSTCSIVKSVEQSNENSGKEAEKAFIKAQSLKKRRSIDKNTVGSPRKIKTLRKTQEPTRIMRHNSCYSSPSEFPVNLHLPKAKISNSDIPQKTLIQHQESESEWLPAETFFRDLDSFQTPVQKMKVHFESNNSELKHLKTVSYSLSKIANSTKNNNIETRMRSAKSVCRNYALKLNSASNIVFEDQGRASIARLRTENCGMVLAKAKLFDDFNDCS